MTRSLWEIHAFAFPGGVGRGSAGLTASTNNYALVSLFLTADRRRALLDLDQHAAVDLWVLIWHPSSNI
jgi:hypothetical protein